MILDFHTHIFPDELARRAMISMSNRSMIEFFTYGTDVSIKSAMKEAGITHSVICNIAVKPGQAANVIQFAEKTMRENPPGTGERLIPLASVHPFDEDYRERLAQIKELGFAGIKLHPDYQEFYINDHRLESFYHEVNRLGLLMLFHTGVDIGYPEPYHAMPEMIWDILPVLEEGVCVLAHLGGYKMENQVMELLCGRNIYLDTAYNLDLIPIDTLYEIVKKHSPEKILFATDSPWRNQKAFVDYFTEQFTPKYISKEDGEKIVWSNGAKLLGIE